MLKCFNHSTKLWNDAKVCYIFAYIYMYVFVHYIGIFLFEDYTFYAYRRMHVEEVHVWYRLATQFKKLTLTYKIKFLLHFIV